MHIPDVREDPEYNNWEARKRNVQGHFRRSDVTRGNSDWVVGIDTFAVRPFTEKQIELVSTFADQAAIAIEKCVCSKASKRERANWQSRWKTCVILRIAWCRPKSSPRSGS